MDDFSFSIVQVNLFFVNLIVPFSISYIVLTSVYETCKVYLPKLLELVSAGEVLEAISYLSICINFTVFSCVMACNNKMLVAYLGVVLLFVCQTSTFDSPLQIQEAVNGS